jgi:hypothetical protein
MCLHLVTLLIIVFVQIVFKTFHGVLGDITYATISCSIHTTTSPMKVGTNVEQPEGLSIMLICDNGINIPCTIDFNKKMLD